MNTGTELDEHMPLHRPVTRGSYAALLTAGPVAGPVAALVVALAAALVAGCFDASQQARFDTLKATPVMLAVDKSAHLFSGEPLRPLPDIAPDAFDAPMVQLGKLLYHDSRLSADGTVACASCHDLVAGGDDGKPHSVGIRNQVGPINAPTTLNSGFNFRQFWDGRAATLAEQAAGPVAAEKEMGAQWERVVVTLASDDALATRFEAAFGDKAITRERVTEAIASYERLLVTRSPFDRYLEGQRDAIDPAAAQGYALFKQFGCVACHQGINVGGNLYQKFGALQSASADIDEGNPGLGGRTQRSDDLSVFKVPSLRNVALTAPYFHSGAVTKLDDAVRIMGLSQLGRSIEDEDRRLIVAFLESLTGEVPAEALP